MKKTNFIILLLSFCFSVGALDLVPTKDLLASYLEHDSDLMKSAINLQKIKLDQEVSDIDSGFSIQLSTGAVKFVFDDKNLSLSPNVNISFPNYSNFNTKVSAEISSKSGVNDVSIKTSADLLSNTKTLEINRLKNQRKLLEAERELSSKVLEKEQAFYKNLQTLLTDTSSIISKQQDYYSDKINFEKIKAQGYAKSSSTYRRAEMKVIDDEHDIESKERSLIYDYQVFYTECGYEIEIENVSDYMLLIPSDIEMVEPLNVKDFPSATYNLIEKAVWNQKIAELERAADRNYSFGANAGYTFLKDGKSDSIDLGIDGTYSGVTLSLGVELPVSEPNKTALTLSAKVNPNTFKKEKIEAQKQELELKEESITLESAISSYDKKVQEKKLKLEQLLWAKNTNDRNYSMYENLENDMYKWFKQGIISESEYLSAKVNREKSFVSQISNYIDMIVYNSEIRAMFTTNEKINRDE